MGLCIGTVQFGTHYGIASKEHPAAEDSIKILEYAFQSGIRVIDTASSYGLAEKIVGGFLKGEQRSGVRIVTKIRPDALQNVPPGRMYSVLKKEIQASLKKLNTEYVDALMFHNPDYVFNPGALEALARLKQDKFTLKTGVSIYLREQLEAANASPHIDIVQIPFNILDQRMLPVLSGKRQGLEVHARSAFLQGLLLMPEEDIPSHLSGVLPYIRLIAGFCAKMRITRNALLLGFVKKQKAINEIVFGVDSISHLKQTLADYQTEIDEFSVLEFAKQFRDLEDYILMPNLWKGDK